jgi:putative mRNA 3-end processing factor
MPALIVPTEHGLWCPAGGFYIDPWLPVDCAIVTHAHADHLRVGSRRYVLASSGAAIARRRLGPDAAIESIRYGERLRMGEVEVSLHPAGHILGSAQVRIAEAGRVWVVSGDYKRDPDPTCAAFEPLECDVFISEATFALPIYRWPPACEVVAEILEWWRDNRERGVASVLFAYALGKAQRLLAELLPYVEEPVVVHGAVGTLVEDYRAAGIAMAPTRAADADRPTSYSGALVVAPPSAAGSPWMRRFGDHVTGFCSGWMRVRGDRRRRGYDRGFVLSDHADWPSLLRTFEQTRARTVLLTHGHSETMVRYLRERSIEAAALKTAFGAEE